MFEYRRIYVSPHRRTIMTAVNLFKLYKRPAKFILLPLAKEYLNNTNDLVVEFEDLLTYT